MKRETKAYPLTRRQSDEPPVWVQILIGLLLAGAFYSVFVFLGSVL